MAKKVSKKSNSHVRRNIYSIAIALLLLFFIIYAIQSIYPGPKQEDYCPMQNKPLYSDPTTQVQCVDMGGNWSAYLEKGPDNRTGYCDLWTQCNYDYQIVRTPYERNVFITYLILGLIVLITAFFLAIESLSIGFMGGGVLLMIVGAMRYWSELSDILRTLFLGVALGVLVYFGYKKLKD